MDHAIGWVPDTPHPHVTVTVRTAQGVAPAALLIPLPIGQKSDDLHCPLDDALHLRQGLLNEALELGKRLGGLHPVVPDALEAFGKHMLYHPAHKRIDIDCFPLDPLSLMGPIMIRDAVAIIAVDPPDRDRRTRHIFRQVGRQTLIPCGHITLLDIGDKALAIARVTRIH